MAGCFLAVDRFVLTLLAGTALAALHGTAGAHFRKAPVPAGASYYVI